MSVNDYNLELNYREPFIKPITSFDNLEWIGGDTECASPVITRKFFANGTNNATLFITACGFFDVHINGKAITEYKFLPVLTDVEKRDFTAFLYPINDSTVNRLYCYRFDITEYVIDGDNLLEIRLASGWYKQTERNVEGNVNFGEVLKTIYRIDIADSDGIRTFGSDGSELWQDSEIRYSQLFVGEKIDLTAELNAPSSVIIREAPKTELCEARGVPDKAIRWITPTYVDTVNGRKVYDAGENISGVVRVKTTAVYGSKIVLRFSETLSEDGALDFSSTGLKHTCASGCRQIMTDEFITDGEERFFEPRFVWHAFRYFDVEGDVDDVEVVVIHADTPITAEFHSSSEGLNFLFDAFVRTQLNNMHSSLPSDCPHRERLGYTGDGQVCAPAAMMLLNSREFYEKWIQDILDCQDPITGHIQHTAPFMGGGGGPGGWGSAIIFVPYAFFKQYGDVSVLERCYEPMKKWIGYLQSHSENGLVTHEEQGGWCLGDWCTLEPVKIPASYVNTCYFVKDLIIIENIANILGRESDIPEYEKLRKIAENALINTYRDNDGIGFFSGEQGADAYAVWCGLAGARTAARLAEKYDVLGHFDTGFLGTDILLEVLFEYGYADIALKLLESEELGSFLYMKRHGATTIWEDWDGHRSHNHPMFGASVRQLFTSILGIKQASDSYGYERVIISPAIPKALERASGSICTSRGKITVTWEKKNGELVIKADAPDGVIL